jgi:molybdopterin-containing oxidoreductase family iron-sulfur binding subunit
MAVDRRNFLKLAGLTTLGLVLKPGWELLKGDEVLAAVSSRTTGGKQMAMVIDIRKCMEQENCTKCIDACHLYHNVPDIADKEEEVKWIWKESFHHAFHEQEHEYLKDELKHSQALVLCNHCSNPPCVRVCPTGATWKRESDGIVMMDWHRCIGCRYCVVGCPYGSRSFNWSDPRPHVKEVNTEFPTRMKGVVEKCTFCEERLARGKMPSCVEACSEQAMSFGDLADSHSPLRELLRERYTIRRKPGLGTEPQVYYLV